MKLLALDFVPHRRIGSLLGLVIFMVGAVATLVVGLGYSDALDALDRAEARQTRLLRQTKAELPKRPPSGSLAAAQAGTSQDDGKAAALAMAQLQLPWDALLHELEVQVDPAVALLSIEAQGQARSLRLSGEAKNMADVVVFVTRLRQSASVSAATLSSHEEKMAGPVKVLRFNLDVTWKAPV